MNHAVSMEPWYKQGHIFKYAGEGGILALKALSNCGITGLVSRSRLRYYGTFCYVMMQPLITPTYQMSRRDDKSNK